jgi:hypothetical protein
VKTSKSDPRTDETLALLARSSGAFVTLTRYSGHIGHEGSSGCSTLHIMLLQSLKQTSCAMPG